MKLVRKAVNFVTCMALSHRCILHFTPVMPLSSSHTAGGNGILLPDAKFIPLAAGSLVERFFLPASS